VSRKTGKRKIIPAIMIAGLTAAAAVLVYPEFINSVNDVVQTVNISGYTRDAQAMSIRETEQIRQAAEDYNNKLFEEQLAEPFIYQGQDAESGEYSSLLRISEDSRLMAFIEIPKIGLYLPVTHGTRSDDLRYQAGHMYGTSLPIGGESTHACLTAHTGLETADLFTRVDSLRIGDEVMIHVLGEIHVYMVCEINICKPLEFSQYLQIEKGRDLVTLFTCTPYGINSHRLLVKCERTGDILTEASEGEETGVREHNIRAAMKAAGWLLIPVIIPAAGIVIISRTGRKGTDEEVEKVDCRRRGDHSADTDRLSGRGRSGRINTYRL